MARIGRRREVWRARPLSARAPKRLDGVRVTHDRKPWNSYAEPLDRLRTRGMIVTDRALAREYPERIGFCLLKS